MAVLAESQSKRRPTKRQKLITRPHTQPIQQVEDGGSSLCEACAKIDFYAFLVPSSVGPITFFGLSRDQTCAFCNYVRRAVRDDAGAVVDDDVLEHYKFRIEQRTVPVTDRLRASQTLVAPRLVLYAYPRLPQGFAHSNTCLAMLELDGEDVTPVWRANAFWTSRRPRGSHFNIALLEAWLRTTQEGEEQNSLSTEADEVLLQGLIEQRCFRVLDVATCQVVALDRFERFFALSYVWGQTDFATMIKHDVQETTPRSYFLHVCWTLNGDRIPKTIRDAMSLVQRLRERYLWVDSVCIRQASTDDKATIIHDMRSIYRSAALTIVAAEGGNADAGLRRLTCQGAVEQPLIVPQGDKLLRLYPALPGLEDMIKATAWNGRGWTYQERILSKACVYFTRDEVLFSSGGIVEREAYAITNNPKRPMSTYRRKTPSIGKQATLQGALSQPITTVDHRIHRYQEAVTEFTRRKLTHPGDRLDAFSGILALLKGGNETEEEMQALSGLLPASTEMSSTVPTAGVSASIKRFSTRINNAFVASLLWQPNVPVTTVTRIPHNAMNTRALPSWSWAGWACEAHYPSRTKRKVDCAGTVVLNENNVQLPVPPDVRYPLWPYQPTPSKLSRQESFVLHLWRPLLRARLHLRDEKAIADLPGWSTYQILVSDGRDPEKQLCMVDVAHEFMQPHPEDHLFEFVPLDWGEEVYSPRDLLLVQRKGECFERVALSYGTPVWLEHLQALEYQHIQLV